MCEEQFRVAKVQNVCKVTPDESQPVENETNDHEKETSNNTVNESNEKVVPKTDKEIVDAGTAFLDMIGKNFGYR